LEIKLDATTILAYKGKNKAVIGGDGQVTFGDSVLKGNATKIRTLHKGKILAGFAGSTADAFNLFDMFEDFLEDKKGDILKSVVEFSKAWRKDKVLRRLEAMMIVLNQEHIFILTGNGDVVEPEDGEIASIGSGGNFAISAARALKKHAKMDEEELVKESLSIAADLCIYTNHNIKTLNLTPKEIVEYLDKYVIGALRTRYRRMQLIPEMQQEITPKNILMIGSTGVGKTEISRRLATMMSVPFIMMLSQW